MSLAEEINNLTNSAEFDQALAAFHNMVKLVTHYYGGYVEAGMSPTHAFRLTRDYHMLLIMKSMWPDAPPSIGGDERKG